MTPERDPGRSITPQSGQVELAPGVMVTLAPHLGHGRVLAIHISFTKMPQSLHLQDFTTEGSRHSSEGSADYHGSAAVGNVKF
jgi:hypothetical protein